MATTTWCSPRSVTTCRRAASQQVSESASQRVSKLASRRVSESADDFDVNSQVEILPIVVGSVGRGLALERESQTGAVAERKSVGPRCRDEFRGFAGLRRCQRADFALESLDAAPSVRRSSSERNQARMNLGHVDCANKTPFEERNDIPAAPLAQEKCQQSRGIENRKAPRGRARQRDPLTCGLPWAGLLRVHPEIGSRRECGAARELAQNSPSRGALPDAARR